MYKISALPSLWKITLDSVENQEENTTISGFYRTQVIEEERQHIQKFGQPRSATLRKWQRRITHNLRERFYQRKPEPWWSISGFTSKLIPDVPTFDYVPINILLVGQSGVGKKSTLEALYSYHDQSEEGGTNNSANDPPAYWNKKDFCNFCANVSWRIDDKEEFWKNTLKLLAKSDSTFTTRCNFYLQDDYLAKKTRVNIGQVDLIVILCDLGAGSKFHDSVVKVWLHMKRLASLADCDVPFILAGNKKDTVSDAAIDKTEAQAENLARMIHASGYGSFSATTRAGLAELVDSFCKVAMFKTHPIGVEQQ